MKKLFIVLFALVTGMGWAQQSAVTTGNDGKSWTLSTRIVRIVFIGFSINSPVKRIVYPVYPITIYPVSSGIQDRRIKTRISVFIRMNRIIFTSFFGFLNCQAGRSLISIYQTLHRDKS